MVQGALDHCVGVGPHMIFQDPLFDRPDIHPEPDRCFCIACHDRDLFHLAQVIDCPGVDPYAVNPEFHCLQGYFMIEMDIADDRDIYFLFEERYYFAGLFLGKRYPYELTSRSL